MDLADAALIRIAEREGKPQNFHCGQARLLRLQDSWSDPSLSRILILKLYEYYTSVITSLRFTSLSPELSWWTGGVRQALSHSATADGSASLKGHGWCPCTR